MSSSTSSSSGISMSGSPAQATPRDPTREVWKTWSGQFTHQTAEGRTELWKLAGLWIDQKANTVNEKWEVTTFNIPVEVADLVPEGPTSGGDNEGGPAGGAGPSSGEPETEPTGSSGASNSTVVLTEEKKSEEVKKESSKERKRKAEIEMSEEEQANYLMKCMKLNQKVSEAIAKSGTNVS